MSKEKPNDWARLHHIKDAIEKLAIFVSDMDEEQFLADDKTVLASIKIIEIVGEAVYHLTKDLKNKYDDIPWKKIEWMRHRLVHDYYEIDSAIIWRVATVYIPQLGEDIKTVVSDLDA